MSRKQCTGCLFRDKCDGSELCDNYYPVDDHMDDVAMDGVIQKHYEEFLQEWDEYINGFYD